MTSAPEQAIDQGSIEALVAEVTSEVLARLAHSDGRLIFGTKR